ncbi:hypothetical protein K440DRAFT_634822 [Wilcoxina mikolae CBS 423.85]|nr:hypothetical protein K440DRAFT_634822 [Wilcoxina mikolae CBS 423.85]
MTGRSIRPLRNTDVTVDGKMFTNTAVRIEFLARNVPKSKMPNQYSGVILGQVGVINVMEVRTVPRDILRA